MKTNEPKPEFENIIVETTEKRCVIRLLRPESKNSLSRKTLEEIDRAWSTIFQSDEFETVVFTGSGDSFASGANLKEISQTDDAREFALRGQNVFQKIYHSRINTIAAINGYCMGGGLDLALSCKRRIATVDAVFSHPGANLGIMTGWGGTQLLPRLLGESNALEIFLTGKTFSAHEALRIGLIDNICNDLLGSALTHC